jgi:hypothetical protein
VIPALMSAGLITLRVAGDSVLPKAGREVVILAIAARFGSLCELYSHETVAAKSGLPASKIRTIAAGERPSDLTCEESMVYDMAAVLNREHQVQTRPMTLRCPPSAFRVWAKSPISSAATA